MAGTQLDFDEVRGAAKSLNTAKGEIESKLNALSKRVHNLADRGFKMPNASEKFRENYREWDSGTKKTIAALEGMSKVLNGIVEDHEGLDRKWAK